MTRLLVAGALAVAAVCGGAAHASTCVTVNGLLVTNACVPAGAPGVCESHTVGRPGLTVTITTCT